MPYSKEHKEITRDKILASAFRFFTTKGFDGITVNEIMEGCKLTRGAFYAHFKSKAELYGESINFAALNSKLAELKPVHTSDKEWLRELLNGYLSIEHVNGTRACPLAFLTTDIATRDSDAKQAYSNAYKGMNKIIQTYANSYTKCSEGEILALTSMMIGAVAISRTIDDEKTVKKILEACRNDAGKKLGNI